MKNRILDLRTDADLRQIDVANAIGITQRKYSYIETGTQQVTEEMLVKLASFYNTSVDYLLGLTDDPAPYPRKRTK
ncbi:MAG: helix-turn-helix domain-containing protein [Oscillospiraceae bacterium]|nr:helix-turn-helix domain-containing protein [Oscillospiraceae bacterium]